ncbi:MAG: TraR/DksA family transcriptional regulator [Gammaproteobacteria bacterium]
MPDTRELEKFRQHLLQARQDLRDQMESGAAAAKVVVLDQTSVGRLSRMDALQGQAMSLEQGRRRELGLQKIAAALRRLEKGEFGYCVTCGEPIAAKRLEMDPAVSLCIDCASAAEII